MKTIRRVLCLILTVCLAASWTAALAQNADGVTLKYRDATPEVTAAATPEVTATPEPVITPEPTPTPTVVPETPVPTEAPTEVPTEAPTAIPTEIPTEVPTEMPTAIPTEMPTEVPTVSLTEVPTELPTQPAESDTPQNDLSESEAQAPAVVNEETTEISAPVEQPAESQPTEEIAPPAENAGQAGGEGDWFQGGIPGRMLPGFESDRQGSNAKGRDPYAVSIIGREEKDNPRTVLIMGTVYAPEGAEIQDAVVETGSNAVRPNEVVRFRNVSAPPEGVNAMSAPFDPNRTGFAFLADLSGNKAGEDGSLMVTVRLAVGDYQVDFTPFTVYLSDACYAYPDVEHALRGLCIFNDEKMQEVGWLQDHLAEKEYLDAELKTRVYDENTARAMKDLCAINDLDYSEDGVLPATLSAVLSDQFDGKNDGIMGYLKRYITIADYDIPMWMLAAAGAGLILLILIIVLIITGVKRKKKKKAALGGGFDVPGSGGSMKAPHTDPEAGGGLDGGIEELGGEDSIRDGGLIGGIPAGGLEGPGDINYVGDGDTVDMDTIQKPMGIAFGSDAPTVDLAYKLLLRMFYNEQYMDTQTDIPEGGMKIIGRGRDAELQTNPADNSVSHRHGQFAVESGNVTYTDTSRNGTRVNGQRTLQNGEKITLQFNTKYQLEIGSHKIWVLVKK